ncbi:PadR family transcriptional regulator [Actinoallomurus spadix]|uniref:Transcription regulator PadR N-terminal domain-containing protein n=1 Tax=Actinoallomurus spadix TaxID=79912 RepID=A0ABN0W7N1_9ACTN|nr:PadR family transcriptional regulator [Actinoallomurus spadix]MCO5990672.1 PadR family transcriptional regulator [Actinoallomurus spadix]
MSPVFGHGRLRLYLLKLLEESPRHGYEVIRLLQDRFLGVYSPSPGTIYPRLARLEEEGLVTHEVVQGKKVYRLTDAGRDELERRMDELAELEEELTESVRDIAREVQEDVRDTVRSLREELTQAAREMRRQGPAGAAQNLKETTRRQKDEWQRQKAQWKEHKRALQEEWRFTWDEAWATATGTSEDAARVKLDRALRKFVDEVRSASRDGLDEEQVAAVRTILAETSARLRTEILGKD